MGLDMRPLGKPKTGFEERFVEIHEMLSNGNIPKPSLLDQLKGKKFPTEKELLEEWFEIQIPSYITIKAPQVGKDKEADEWVKREYEKLDDKPPFDAYYKAFEEYYVIELAKEQDGLPVYISVGQDENVFRGQFLQECEELIGEELVSEAWNTKLAGDALDYGNRLMKIADELAQKYDLENLKNQRFPPETNEDSIESKLHIIFSLAKWLIFYGKNGHGYEADF